MLNFEVREAIQQAKGRGSIRPFKHGPLPSKGVPEPNIDWDTWKPEYGTYSYWRFSRASTSMEMKERN